MFKPEEIAYLKSLKDGDQILLKTLNTFNLDKKLGAISGEVIFSQLAKGYKMEDPQIREMKKSKTISDLLHFLVKHYDFSQVKDLSDRCILIDKVQNVMRLIPVERK